MVDFVERDSNERKTALGWNRSMFPLRKRHRSTSAIEAHWPRYEDVDFCHLHCQLLGLKVILAPFWPWTILLVLSNFIENAVSINQNCIVRRSFWEGAKAPNRAPHCHDLNSAVSF